MPTVAAPHGGVIPAESGNGRSRTTWALTVGSIGVVYGDIGTSPLYALREAVAAASALAGAIADPFLKVYNAKGVIVAQVGISGSTKLDDLS